MPATLEMLRVLVGVAVPLASFATGLRSTDPLWLWKRPRLLVRSLLAILVVVPLVEVLLAGVLAAGNVYLRAGIVVSILAIGIGPPNLLKRTRGSQEVACYGIGLNITLMLAAIVYLPLATALHGAVFHHQVIPPWTQVARVVLVQALLPFFAGVALARWVPRLAAPLERHAPQVVGAAMLTVVVVALLAVWRPLVGLGVRAWLVCALVAAVAIGIGHLAGGPGRDTRGVLAGFSAMRFPGLALLIAASVPGGRGAALVPVILAYVLTSGILVGLYQAAMGRRAVPHAPATI
jgi:BASS family bile acid:Na+ symporter